uniref:Ig-like domain-containing protein n=1 Tax=Pelusios castaneus TaxID=367368 RepID=A0A8C8RWG9_9SAUR
VSPSSPSVTFSCFITGYFPKPVAMKWNLGSISTGMKSFPAVMSSSNIDSLSSQIDISASSWQGTTYHGVVEHKLTSTSISKQIPSKNATLLTPTVFSPKENSSTSDTQVFFLPPSPTALYVDSNAKLTCMVVNVYENDGLKMAWYPEKHELIDTKEQDNNTYTTYISRSTDKNNWEKGETFSCTVEHPDLLAPIRKTLSKKSPKRAQERHPLSHSRDTISLTCLVQGFFPDGISVQWQKNQKASKNLEYITITRKDGAGYSTFFLYSKLKVSKDSWEKGDTYTCMVSHEALLNKSIKETVSKVSGK